MCAKRKSSRGKKTLFSQEFYSDLGSENMLYASLVRSPFESGIISDITLKSASEDVFLITAKDIPGKNSCVTLNESCEIFADQKILYKGQCLALVTSDNPETARQLASKVKLKYKNRELLQKIKSFKPSGQSIINSSGSSSSEVKTHDRFFSNCDSKEMDKIFSSNDLLVIKEKWTPHYLEEYKGECNGAFCYVKGGSLHIYTPSRWINHLRKNVSRVTGYSEEKIIITRTNLGRSNPNDLWMNTIITCQACVAAIKSQRPVQLILSREEQNKYICNYAKLEIEHKTAVNSDGVIKAMDINIKVNTGCFNPLTEEYLNRLIIAGTGIYTPPLLRIHAVSYRNTANPLTIKLSLSDCYAQFAVEGQIYKIAGRLKKSVYEIKQLNSTYFLDKKKNNSFPFNHTFDPVTFRKVFDTVCLKSNYNRKDAVYRLSKSKESIQPYNLNYCPPIKGIGMSSCFEGSTFFGSVFLSKNNSLEVTLTEDNTLIIQTTPPSATVCEIWKTIAKDILGLEKKDILIEKEDFNTEDNIPESVNGSISVKTTLLRKACEAIKRKKNKTGLPVTVKKGISYTQKKLWNNKTFSGEPFYSSSFGTCVVEAEIEPCTYREKILSIKYVIDAGSILNIDAAKNTVLNATYRCLKQLVNDEIVSCSNVTVDFIESKTEARQLGHIVYSLLPSAYTQALSQAVDRCVNTLPINTDTIFNMVTNTDSEEY